MPWTVSAASSCHGRRWRCQPAAAVGGGQLHSGEAGGRAGRVGSLLGTMMPALRDAEATAFIGAEPHQRSEKSHDQRHGNRDNL
jgi:hypothetical protein